MTKQIELEQYNTFRGFDRHFAEYINSIAKMPSPELFCAAALSTYFLREGHTRYDLSQYAGSRFNPDGTIDSGFTLPELDKWLSSLTQSGVAGSPGDYTPLIVDNYHLYLYRYWNYEDSCAKLILSRTSRPANKYPEDRMHLCLSRFFFFEDDDQRHQIFAAASAIQNSFTVITGGPGTGKTSTVAKIVASLLLLNESRNFQIALAAPTGKAAMRLSESLSRTRQSLKLPPGIADIFPDKALTIHSLLGTIPGSTHFRFNKWCPLPFDLVIIDEASMIDCALMAKLLNAIPESCSLILLGDKDQLSSVEAGSIFGDICGSGNQPVNPDHMRNLTTPFTAGTNLGTGISSPLSNSIVKLEKNFRFRSDAGIGKLSKAINSGNYHEVRSILQNDPTCTLVTIQTIQELRNSLNARVKDWCSRLCRETDPERALNLLDEFRILCALRQGTWGAVTINDMVKTISGVKKSVSTFSTVYHGLPIMISVNDYRQNLFNGDTGIILRDGSTSSAFFRNSDGTIKAVNLRMLPGWELAFAITVHKSQGSEFIKSLLILPPAVHPLITRELLYTAVTRSRTSIELWCTESVLKRGIETVMDRRSGLQDRLWK